MNILILGRNYGSIMNCLIDEYRKIGHNPKGICFDYHVNKHCDNSLLYMVYGQKSAHKPLTFKLKTFLGICKLMFSAYRADVIHVFSDIQLHNRFESKILHFVFNKISKSKLKYITFLGSEVRNPELEKPINPFFKQVHETDNYEYKKDETPENSILIQKKYSALGFRAILNPEVIHFINQEILQIAHNYNHPGIASFKRIDSSNEKIVFMHAGTAPFAKGSFEINRIFDELIAEGYPIEYKFVTKVSIEEFNYILGTTDVYIDQMIWGWYGVAAIQALSLGIPVISFLGETQLKHCPETGIVNANLNNLKAKIIELCDNPEQLKVIGANGLLAYHKNHEPSQVASHLINCYSSDRQKQ